MGKGNGKGKNKIRARTKRKAVGNMSDQNHGNSLREDLEGMYTGNPSSVLPGAKYLPRAGEGDRNQTTKKAYHQEENKT